LNLPLGQEVLDSFKAYLDDRGVYVSGPIENAFDDFMQAAKQLDPEFPDKAPISSIRSKINVIERESWEKNRDEILENLSITLSNLAFDDEEIYEKYYLRYDPVIRAALNLLENRKEYKRILEPQG
jgi:hypothetical protein